VRAETDVYCCGPAPLMQAVKEASAHWPSERVHFEYFAAPAIDWPANQPFEVELARSGEVLPVPRDRTLLQALRAHGVDVPSACEEGVCGTCEVRVCAGEPEHRDMLLTDAEKAAGKTMMVCVSRSRSPRLVLDL
jgi:ferredoxin